MPHENALTHQKNPLAGWDISASATGEKGEKISGAEILVNGFSQYDESFEPSLDQWQRLLTQQGDFRADNTSELKVMDDQGNIHRAQESWS